MNKKRKKRSRGDGTASADKWKRGANPKNAGTTFKPKPGTTYIKLVVPDFAEGFEHWLDDLDGNKVKLNCQDSIDRKTAKCKVCKAATKDNSIQTNHRYYFAVVVGRPKTVNKKKMVIFDPTIEIMEVGTKIGSVICAYAGEIIEDIDGEWEEQDVSSITDAVIKITRKGEGISTSYETRIANVKYKVDGDIGDVPDFDTFIKPATNKTVDAVLGIGSHADDEDDDTFGDDEFDEELDDEDEESEDEEDDDWELDEDEEDEEDDDEEDEDWELDDEEDEKPAKRKPKKPHKKHVSSKRKPASKKRRTRK